MKFLFSRAYENNTDSNANSKKPLDNQREIWTTNVSSICITFINVCDCKDNTQISDYVFFFFFYCHRCCLLKTCICLLLWTKFHMKIRLCAVFNVHQMANFNVDRWSVIQTFFINLYNLQFTLKTNARLSNTNKYFQLNSCHKIWARTDFVFCALFWVFFCLFVCFGLVDSPLTDRQSVCTNTG